MAINLADFFQFSLNQFEPNASRGVYRDWGLSAQIIECELDASETNTVYSGDAVTIVATSTGKLKVKKAAAADPVYGFVIYRTFSSDHASSNNATKYVHVLRDGGVMHMVTEAAVAAGAAVYYSPADGSITGTSGAGTTAQIGIAVQAVPAKTGGQLILVEVKK